MQLTCQFIHPHSGGRSQPFHGDYAGLLGMLEEMQDKFLSAEKSKPRDEHDPEFDQDKSIQEFEAHVVLVLYENPSDDPEDGFFSRRPPLTIPRFRLALQTSLQKETANV